MFSSNKILLKLIYLSTTERKGSLSHSYISKKKDGVQIKAKHTWPISLSPSLTKTASLTSSTSVFQMDFMNQQSFKI